MDTRIFGKNDAGENPISRREFLKSAGTLFGALLAGDALINVGSSSAARAEQKEEAPHDNRCELIVYRSKYEHIEYPENQRQLPEHLKKVLDILRDFQRGAVALFNIEGAKGGDEKKVASGFDAAAFDKLKKAIWEQICTAQPEAQMLSFSDAAFFEYIGYSVPRLFAPFGIS